MKYRMIKLLGITMIGLMSMVGCATNQGVEPIESAETLQLQNQVEAMEQENRELQQQVDELQVQVDQLTTENKSLLLQIEEASIESYVLYDSDIDTYDIIEVGSIKLDKQMAIQEKVQSVADELSHTLFSGLGIEVQEIKTQNNETVALINLTEDETTGTSWMQHQFQGSTGAIMTKHRLEETLLQRNNAVEWVDGIQLLYEGDKLFIDHLTFDGVIYR